MTYDKKQIREHIYSRARALEREVAALKAKARINEIYQRIHDEMLGALYVCLHLENDSSLVSKDLLFNQLSYLLEEEFDVPIFEVFTQIDFERGVVKEANRIISYVSQ